MSPNKLDKKENDRPRSIHILSSIKRYFVTLPSTTLDIRILGAAIVLLTIVLTGRLMSKDALAFVLVILGYLLLRYHAKKSEKK